MKAKGSEAFDLDEEAQSLRVKYGRNQFGQGCLLARRLIERGVSFVEVSLSNGANPLGWDTHVENFKAVQSLSATLDAGFSTLVADLADRGLLSSTLIVWMVNSAARRKSIPTTAATTFPWPGPRC